MRTRSLPIKLTLAAVLVLLACKLSVQPISTPRSLHTSSVTQPISATRTISAPRTPAATLTPASITGPQVYNNPDYGVLENVVELGQGMLGT